MHYHPFWDPSWAVAFLVCSLATWRLTHLIVEEDGPFDLILGLACYLAPLAVLEVYLRARDQGGALGKSVMAAALVVLTAAMGVGLVGACMLMWRPFL